MSNLIGQYLGRYHILEPLGEGGMAVVYKAYDTRLESDVAVKVIRTERLAPDILQRAMKRFEREAKSLAQLTHPNLVKVLDYGEYEGQPYLVMPYLMGGTLKQKMKGQPMQWQEVARLLIPIARALDYAHTRNLIHRDVKPSNILITESGEPMLTDFGVAKIIDEEATMDLTGTSATVGTPEYMAPEQVVSKNVDHRADIYALGVVFYEMVTGRKPFTADTPMAVLFKHASEPLPRPTLFVPGLPEAAEKILLKALAKKPDDRYQGIGEMINDLQGIAEQERTSKPIANQPRRDETATIVADVFPVLARQDDEGNIQSPAPRRNPLRAMGDWRQWLPIGMLVILLGLALSIGNGLLSLGKQGLGPLSGLATDTSTPTRTAIPNTPTPIPTSTATPIPLPTPLGGGGMIVFSSEQGGDSEIYIVSPDGSGLAPLTSNSQSDDAPSLSPDGKKIAFCSDRDGDLEIYIMNIDGSGVSQITNNDKRDWSPDWSPDGKRIAFASNSDGDSEIYIMNVDGSQVTQVTENSWYDYDPDWSPDGMQIVFSTYLGNQCGEIFIANSNGSNLLQLTDNSKCDYSPSWSPDGKRIAFSSDRDGDEEIYTMGADGKEVVQITNNEKNQDDRNPDWSPDGRHIIFESSRDGDYDVYIMDIDGKGIVQLTQNSWFDGQPCWE